MERLVSVENRFKLNTFSELNSILSGLQSKMCRGEDLCGSAGCSHSCHTFENEAFCRCPAQLILDVDYKTCVPIGSSVGANMCNIQNGGCDHRYESYYDQPTLPPY